MSFDTRTTLLRDGIAARGLEGIVDAEVYLDPTPMTCGMAATGIHREASAASEQMDQLLFGERFDVLEEDGGFVLGQARRDGYVGYVAKGALTPLGPRATHRVATLRTYAFEGPSIKSRAMGLFSLNSLVTVEAEEGRLAKVTGSGWVAADHLAPIGVFEEDPAAVALRFVGAPYLWGGRESLGLDCSGLVQQALFACGMACPRDTDQQQTLGREIAAAEFGRNDLVFWKGHVAIGLGEGKIIHANASHMMTAVEPLADAVARPAYGEPTGYRRVL
ncbi:C40 family peptidase [Phenylobacterium sp. J426]|uniref:C40 family peptidase n=1 Tax=Phenylobacterium sp. J426 TaxID=2898439 RepID=UPI0021514407|nr:C40 family peptidase [Phenylobacterium sp. J426]MCR5873480.1 C40 family peptidase [Phenylobacterium sp. J426]